MSETCRGHLWDKIIVKLFASSWYIFLTYIYDARSHLYLISEACCLLGSSVPPQIQKKCTGVSETPATSVPPGSTLVIVAARALEMSIHFYQTTRRHIVELIRDTQVSLAWYRPEFFKSLGFRSCSKEIVNRDDNNNETRKTALQRIHWERAGPVAQSVQRLGYGLDGLGMESLPLTVYLPTTTTGYHML